MMARANRRKKSKKQRKREREIALDEKFGKSQTNVLVHTAVGSFFINPYRKVPVRMTDENGKERMTTVFARDLNSNMHVIVWKEVLSHLTLDDIHNDLMRTQWPLQVIKSNAKKRKEYMCAVKYRVAHNLLHDNPDREKDPNLPRDAEIPVLRKLLFNYFDPHKNPASIVSISNFKEKLFKVSGQDFSKKIYYTVGKEIRNKLANKLFGKDLKDLSSEELEKVPSPSLLNSWLRGEVVLPRKIDHVISLGVALGEPELVEMAKLKPIWEYWSTRRSGLRAYVACLKEKGEEKVKHKWGSEGHSKLEELQVLLSRRIHEIHAQTLTVGVNRVEFIKGRPGQIEKTIEAEKGLKLSRNILYADTPRSEELRRRMESIGYDTRGIEFSTLEEDMQKEREEELAKEAARKAEKLAEKKRREKELAAERARREAEKKAKLELLRQKRMQEEEQRLREAEAAARREKKRIETAMKVIREFRSVADERSEASVKLFNDAMDSASQEKDHMLHSLVRVIDFISTHGLNREKLVKDLELEKKIASDMMDGQPVVSTMDNFERAMRNGNHSFVELFDKIYDAHPEISETMGSRNNFAARMLNPMRLNFERVVKKWKKLSRKNYSAKMGFKEFYLDLLNKRFDAALDVFDWVAKNRAEEARRIHELSKQMPPIFLPLLVTRFYDNRVQGSTPWNQYTKKLYEDLSSSIGHPIAFKLEFYEK